VIYYATTPAGRCRWCKKNKSNEVSGWNAWRSVGVRRLLVLVGRIAECCGFPNIQREQCVMEDYREMRLRYFAMFQDETSQTWANANQKRRDRAKNPLAAKCILIE